MRPPRKRNPMARDLRTPKYRPRVVRARKGKAAYNRHERGRNEDLQAPR